MVVYVYLKLTASKHLLYKQFCDGYFIDAECPKWTYGDYCEDQCLCNKTNSLSCHEDTGKCSCKAGYFGDYCNCIAGVHNCDTTTSICHTNSSGNAVCLCKDGVFSGQSNKCFSK